MGTCKCGAHWRQNFPFGKRSKGRRVYVTHHIPDCPFRERKIFKINRQEIEKRKNQAEQTARKNKKS